MVAWVLIVMVAFAGFRMAGVTTDDVTWLRDRVAEQVADLIGPARPTSDSMPGVSGSGGEGYTFSALQPDGVSPVTWPCEGTIPVEVNPQGAPEDHTALVANAITRINAASGFRFEVVAETDDRNFLERRAGPVLLGFSDEDEIEALSGRTAGVGGSVFAAPFLGAELTAVGGMVALDRELFSSRMPAATAEAIIMHELAHVLGLGHTDARGELMRPSTTFQVDFGEGDLAGLSALREHACS